MQNTSRLRKVSSAVKEINKMRNIISLLEVSLFIINGKTFLFEDENLDSS